MDAVPRRSHLRMVSRLVVPLAFVGALVLGAPLGIISAQIDPQVRDRVVPAIVEIAIDIDATENGSTEARYLPVGSGTIVSPDGLILSNWHVVDMAAHRAQLDAWEAQATKDGESLTFVLHEDRVLILATDGASVPVPVNTAEVVAEHHALDLAVLRITGDEYGATLPGSGALPFVPLGDSSTVRQGDPIDLFGYPMIGGDTLTYTDGVVSGFGFEEGIEGPAWITTNATMSGGSSGGAALDRAGRLIGIPTRGTELDCRPGDTNSDGTINEEDVGCIPMGGSIGQLRPINLAKPLLLEAGYQAASAIASTAGLEATIEAYAEQQRQLDAEIEQQRATIDALATREAAQATEAANVAAIATQNAASSANELATAQADAAARATEVAVLQTQRDFAEGTVAPLATAQANAAERASEVAVLQAQQINAQVTATALAVVAANSVLDPNRQTISIETDLEGMLANDDEALADARNALSTQLSRYPTGCRAGFMLISGKAPEIGEGVELARRVEKLLPDVRPEVFTEATGVELFALPNTQPFGEASIDIFFYSGCDPIG